MIEPVIITYDDCRKAGYCVAGLRSYFKKHNGDLDEFLRNGISAEALLEWRDDAMTRRLIRIKTEN